MKRKVCFLLIAFLLTGNLFATAIQERDSQRQSGELVSSQTGGQSGELILLHTNDFHGALLPNSGKGGLAELAAFVRAVKANNANVLLVDAGDFNTGSALSNMFNAEPVIRGYNIMGYDVATFGNHEFDGTLELLNTQIALAEYPFVSSNIMFRDGSYLGGNRYIVKRYGNFSVGIFGITTLRTRSIASPDDSLVFLNELEAAQEMVDILRNTERVDIVIALCHMGNIIETTEHITSVKLAKQIEGIDIIVDGHSHSLFSERRMAGDSWVVSANEMGKYLGYGKLTIQNGRLVDFSWAAIPVGFDSESIARAEPFLGSSVPSAPDAEVTAMLAPYIERGNAVLKEVIGTASDTFVFGNRLTRYQETALGNLITDANVWFLRNVSNMEIDFAFHNGGNMRAELPAGPITQERILTILPFENYLHVVSMTGSQLIELFDFIATIPQGNGGFPQFSADVRLTIDKTTGNGIIRDLTIGGEPVDPQRIYRLCTNDYILGGGDDYAPMLNATDRFNTSLLLSYTVNEYIRANGAVSPVVDGRMTVVGGVTP